MGKIGISSLYKRSGHTPVAISMKYVAIAGVIPLQYVNSYVPDIN